MDNYVKKHLQDIITAIEEIESFFDNRPKFFEEFNRNLCLRRAVERNVEIIGEAMNRILKANSDIKYILLPCDYITDIKLAFGSYQ